MANASLQIGNGNWAIKEDNLLGYSKAGTRFLPIPITMTRATLGTRVNPSGLIEDVALLGSELVTNGDFATDSDWNKLNGSTISGGVGNVIANGDIGITGSNWSLSQDVGMILGKTYKISFSARQTGGTGNLQVGQAFLKGFNQSITSSFADYSFYITALNYSGNTGKITIGGNINGDTFEVDNVSVKEATIDGLARVDYTDGTASLLAEPQRTNLMLYSEDFSSNWTTSNLSVVEHSTTSPSGETNADKLVEDSSNSSHTIRYANPNTPVTNGVVYTMSFFAKKEERTSIRISNAAMSNTNGKFNLSNGQVISSGSSATNSMVDYGNGWYRCIMTFTSTTTIAQANIAILNANNDITYQGDGSSGLYMWGVQIEAGSYPTSYIKTQGSTVTRNKDEYTKTGISDKINSDEGVLFVEMAKHNGNTVAPVISLNNGTSSQTVALYYFSTDEIAFDVISSSPNVSGVSSSYNTDNFNKIALKYKSGDIALWVNGVEVLTKTNTISLTGLNKISFDYGNGTYSFYGNVRQLQVFKIALSDSELATLTT